MYPKGHRCSGAGSPNTMAGRAAGRLGAVNSPKKNRGFDHCGWSNCSHGL